MKFKLIFFTLFLKQMIIIFSILKKQVNFRINKFLISQYCNNKNCKIILKLMKNNKSKNQLMLNKMKNKIKFMIKLVKL